MKDSLFTGTLVFLGGIATVLAVLLGQEIVAFAQGPPPPSPGDPPPPTLASNEVWQLVAWDHSPDSNIIDYYVLEHVGTAGTIWSTNVGMTNQAMLPFIMGQSNHYTARSVMVLSNEVTLDSEPCPPLVTTPYYTNWAMLHHMESTNGTDWQDRGLSFGVNPTRPNTFWKLRVEDQSGIVW